jgi:glycerophosphoryl diester phosphodiesterase
MPLTWEGLTVFDETVAEVARARGKWVNVWTVDDEAAIRAAIAAGVGGIMTDRPDVLRAVLDGR